ncbi:substrate-binding domain-containing protein [Pseudoalteromonas sp. T1lg76]|uniref:substrate-binding domain-containing protein n=1 Tax=Pseudoalteromonas sp. T1lg76 TaxID=2077103 RepID=UPI000CF60C51|nr:substrate-binding domain-containing protein [Pseudoalteromonas sp. T1lg76]
MTIFRFLLVSFTLSLLLISAGAQADPDAQPLKVRFVNPGHQFDNSTGLFWRNVALAMEAVAEDLDIKLSVTYANRNHILMKSQLNDALRSNADYVIVVDEKKAITKLIKADAELDKPLLFIYNAPQEHILTTKPDWLFGYILPNHFEAGYKLARGLFERAIERFGEGAKLNMLALYGDHTTDSALSRQRGLELFLRQHPEVNLVYHEVANWSAEQGYRKSIRVLSHIKNINMIWAANDPIAGGALRAAASVNSAQLPVVGGINWDKMDTDEHLDVSVGGHVLLGAAALIMLHDAHHQGDTFISSSNFAIFEPDSEQYQILIKAIQERTLGNINFKRFSSLHQEPWPFTLQNLALCIQKGC